MKVVIGKYYRPVRFERRDRDGTYEALRPEMSTSAARLQAALLASSRTQRPTVLEALTGAIGSLV